MGLWNGHPGADNLGSGFEGWRTSPAEPRRPGDTLQRPLRSRFRARLTPDVRHSHQHRARAKG